LEEKWQPHMGEKVWVDIEEFEEAYAAAVALRDSKLGDFYPLRPVDLP
jgi:hypothetical protein